MHLPFCDIPLPDCSSVSPERAEAIIIEANRRYASTTLGVTAWRVAGVAMILIVVPLTILSQPIWLIILIALPVFALIYLPLLVLTIRSHRRAMVQFVEQELAKGASPRRHLTGDA